MAEEIGAYLENRRKVVLIGLVLLIILTGLLIFNLSKQKAIEAPAPGNVINRESLELKAQVYDSVASFTVKDPNCVNVIYSGDPEEKVDVTFLAEKYEDLEKFKEDIQYYIDADSNNNGLLAIEPFKSNPGKFNFYFVNQNNNLDCKLGCYGIDRLVCCDDNKVKQVASACPSDQVFVLADTAKFCGASKDYATVCTIEDSRAGLVLVHEFGHIFGKLGDEYSYGREGETKAPNCDLSGCLKWAGVPGTGCFDTCGYTNLYRSTDKGSLMNIYIPDFGPLNTVLLDSVLSNYSSGQPTQELRPAVPLDQSYITSLRYENGKLNLESLFVTNSTPVEFAKGDYLGKILSFDGELLYAFRLDLPEEVYSFYSPDEADGGKMKHDIAKLDTQNFTFNIPYFKDGKTLEVSDLTGRVVDTISLSPFAEMCGDGICQEQENYLECSADCKIENDNLCLPYGDGVCDSDCPSTGKMADDDCKASWSAWVSVSLVVLVASLLMLLGILFKHRSRSLMHGHSGR